MAVLLLAGCGRSPKKVFGQLQDAAIKKDAKTIWSNLSVETTQELIKRSQEVFREPGGGKASPTEADGREYLAMLAGNLEDLSVEYIRSLHAGTVTVKGDTAEITLSSLRFGSPGKTLVFRKVKGKWVWDAREILDWYLENRSEIANMSQGGF